jgi:hypothetical protein
VTAATPGQAHPLDMLAVLAYAAYRDLPDAAEAFASWRQMTERKRENWRATVDAVQMATSLSAAQQPQPAPDLGAAWADLESDIRVAVSLHCTGTDVPCDLCLRETDRAMTAVDAYARLVAEHERTRPQPAPELRAALAETRQLRDLAGEILSRFSASGTVRTARIGHVQITEWRERAGLET